MSHLDVSFKHSIGMGRQKLLSENLDFELNFEFDIFQKKARHKGGRSLCGSDLFCKMKSMHKQSF